MEKEGVIITREQHPDIYNWLSENVYYYYKEYQKHYTLTSEGKINVYRSLILYDDVTQIKYPFGYVGGFFNCNNCKKLQSLIYAPKEVGGFLSCNDCNSLTSFIGFPKHIKGDIVFYYNTFSNNPLVVEKYKIYIAMWLELLESVSNEERKEYITNYKDKKAGGEPIIPIEIMKEYGF